MDSITVKLPGETIDTLNELAEEEYDGNRSNAVRELIDKGLDYDALEARHEETQRQLRAVNSRQGDVTDLVAYVEQEREMRQRRENRRDAPVWRRARWWLFGRSGSEAKDE